MAQTHQLPALAALVAPPYPCPMVLTASDAQGFHIDRSSTARTARDFYDDIYVMGSWCPQCQQMTGST
jgi:hypothetical protein